MNTHSDAPVLEVSHLSTRLGSTTVLRDVNLRVSRGVCAAIIGPNGAGKTTLLRSIMSIIPSTGTVSIAGDTSRKRVRHIGYVPQSQTFAWDYPLDVSSCVLTGLAAQAGPCFFARRRHWEAVAEALAIVGAQDLATKHIGALSGGQRQRVLLARALVSRPQLLLLDEPGTGLDLPAQQALLDTCTGLAATGVSVIMCTHDIGGAVDACDEIILVNGTVVAHDRPDNLRDPRLWMRVFGVDERSHLLRTAGCAPPHPASHHLLPTRDAAAS